MPHYTSSTTNPRAQLQLHDHVNDIVYFSNVNVAIQTAIIISFILFASYITWPNSSNEEYARFHFDWHIQFRVVAIV